MYSWNATAMQPPATNSQRSDPCCTARVAAQATSAGARTKNDSGWLVRATAARIGVVAVTVPATSPAVGPPSRLAVTATSTTATTVAIALGASTDQVEKPKTRTKIAGTQYEPGILSSETVPVGSIAPNTSFDQLLLIDSATAA